jgi:hypothetical protein
MMAIPKKFVVGALVLFSSLGAGLLLWGLLWGLCGWPVEAQAPGASLAAVWANEGETRSHATNCGRHLTPALCTILSGTARP